MAIGLLLLFWHFPLLVLVILLYGAGYGISWIGRGTLPWRYSARYAFRA